MRNNVDKKGDTNHESRRRGITNQPRMGQPACHTIWRAEEEQSRPRIHFLKKQPTVVAETLKRPNFSSCVQNTIYAKNLLFCVNGGLDIGFHDINVVTVV